MNCRAICTAVMMSCACATVSAGDFRSEDVLFYGRDSLNYAGTLTVPENGVKRHTAVLIVSGSYPQDRDGTMAGHKIYKEIAEYLSARGVAVLRVDDRGVGGSGGDYSLATTYDFSDDVIAAVEYLKGRPDIARRRIGVLGHSEGAASCSIAASRCRDIRFFVSVAGLMTDGLSSVIQQNHDIVANTDGLPDSYKRRYDEINGLMFNTAYEYADADSAVLSAELFRVYDEWKEKDDENVRKEGVESDHFRFPIYMYAMQATTPWYRFFIRYNPGDYLSDVKIPVLAVNGTKDVMVNCSQNLGNVRKYLAHNRHVTTIAIPGLNHLMLPCEKGTPDEYAEIKAPVSAEALSAISEWINDLFQD